MNKTTTRLLLLSITFFVFQLSWSTSLNAAEHSIDSLPPQMLESIQYTKDHTPVIQLAVKGGGDHYRWSTGATTSSIKITPTKPEKYQVVVTKNDNEHWSISKIVYPKNASASQRSAVSGCTGAGLSWQSKVCAGTLVTIEARGGTSYHWATGETTSSISLIPSNGQIFTVTITGAGGCEDVQSTASAPMQVVPIPDAKIAVSNNECSVIGA